MAINFGGFLSGLASGYEDYQGRQDALKKIAFDEARMRRQDLEAEQEQANVLFNQAQEVAKLDALDEAETLQRLRLPTLDTAAKEQERLARRYRFEQNQQIINQLSSQPGLTKQYGDIRGLIRPSMVAGPDFTIPRPEMNVAQVEGLIGEAVKAAQAVPSVDKAATVERYRSALSGLAPQEYIDQRLPSVGKLLTTLPSKQAPTQLERPEEFFKKFPEMKAGIGGERTLDTGAIQKVEYVDGKPMVRYEKPVYADYISPEATQQKNALIQAQTNKLLSLLPYEIQRHKDSSLLAQWNAKLKSIEAAYAPGVWKAKIGKLSQNSSGASLELRKLALLMAAQRDAQRFGLAQQRFGFDQQQAISATRNRLQTQLNAARRDLGAAMTKGQGPSAKAARESVASIQAELNQIEEMSRQILGGNSQSIQAALNRYGSGEIGYISPEMLPEQFGQFGSGMDAQSLMPLLMSMMGGMGQQQPQQPVQGTPPIVFNVGGGGGYYPAPEQKGQPVLRGRPSDNPAVKEARAALGR